VNEKQAHEAILQHWATQWATLHPAGPGYVWWTQLNELGAAAESWVRVAIVPALSRQATIGNPPKWRRSGTIGVQIFVPAGAGTARASELADDVRTVLEGKMIFGVDSEPVVTLAGSTGSPLSDGTWFQVTVTIPFSFDEVR
jgi:hypothetical protein